MEIKYFDFLRQYKDKIGITEGITIEDILDIEKSFNVKLPNVYKEYLLLYGRESGNVLSSYYTEYPALIDNREDALYEINFDESIQEADKPIIKDSYFFFAQWQGYIFYFFDCEEDSEDPSVYILTDTPKIEKYKDHFSVFIKEEGLKPLLESKL